MAVTMPTLRKTKDTRPQPQNESSSVSMRCLSAIPLEGRLLITLERSRPAVVGKHRTRERATLYLVSQEAGRNGRYFLFAVAVADLVLRRSIPALYESARSRPIKGASSSPLRD